MKNNYLIISDLHIPAEHPDALDFLVDIKRLYKINHIISVGDLVDFHAMSFHDHDPNLPSAGDELASARVKLKQWYKAFPTMRIAHSNHDSRGFRKALKAGIPIDFMKGYGEVFDAPDTWTWEEEVDCGSFVVKHGEGHAGSANAIKSYVEMTGRSYACGHHHSLSTVVYTANQVELKWGMAVGCLVDRKALNYAYGKHMPKKPILSAGVVIDGVPAIIPMGM